MILCTKGFEIMDLTEGPGTEEVVRMSDGRSPQFDRMQHHTQDESGQNFRQKLRKNWQDNPRELVAVLIARICCGTDPMT